jgi:hypothetical protein
MRVQMARFLPYVAVLLEFISVVASKKNASRLSLPNTTRFS